MKESNLDVKSAENDLEGPTAAIFSYKDAISPLKALFEFAKKFELPKIKSAFINGIYNNAKDVEIISRLPSRTQLLGQVVGTFKAPLSGLVYVLSGSQKKLVYSISAIAKKKGGVSNE